MDAPRYEPVLAAAAGMVGVPGEGFSCNSNGRGTAKLHAVPE